jgi:cell division inhibitor SulA
VREKKVIQLEKESNCHSVGKNVDALLRGRVEAKIPIAAVGKHVCTFSLNSDS